MCLNSKLPVRNFRFLTSEEYEKIDWKKIKTNGKNGYFVQCDLKYPEEYHDLHSDFPLAPVKGKILTKDLSEKQKTMLKLLKNSGFKRIPTEKLILNLFDKKQYILHFKNLKLYLKLGLVLDKIYRVLAFEQENFLKPYIAMNTYLRQCSETEFEKDLYKLLNNSIYGKSIEDKRKHINVKVAVNRSQCMKLLKKPTFDQFRIIHEDLSIMKMKKTVVLLDKPIAIGCSVLDLSKNYMYKLHYEFFKKHYGEKLNLLYIDTDSFIYLVETQDMNNDLRNIFGNLVDFSNFDINSEYFSEKNKKKIGFLKSESGEKIIEEFVGLKSKLYSIKYADESETRKAKGINRSVLKKELNHEKYREVINDNICYEHKMTRIQSKEHLLKTIELKKMIFTNFDDKRYILDDGITTLPFGHWRITKKQE